MKISELLKRIIDTCNYCEMCPDTEMNIEYICQIVEPLTSKNIVEINKSIISPLMDQYKDSDDNNEMNFIKDTITMICQYLFE